MLSTPAGHPDETKPRSRFRRPAFAVLYCGYVAVVCFLGLKIYAWLMHDIPPTRSAEPDDVWRTYYAELWKSGAIDVVADANDDRLDVLLLGASVLEEAAEPLTAELRKQYRKVRVYNVSVAAHTTRDSAHKMRRLRNQRFDLVIVYHGINDCRMNCIPKADYQDDYSHCAWYDSFQRKLESGTMSIPGLTAGLRRGKIAQGKPEPENRKYGNEIKTANAFRSNLQTILKYAASQKTPVLLMTFAHYLPAGYTQEEFQAGRLDYGKGRHELPVELWGNADNVRRTLETHNAIVRAVSREFGTPLVDQQRWMPKNGKTFSDVCHLTAQGNRHFVRNLMPTIVERFPPTR